MVYCRVRCFPVTDYKNWWLPEGEEEIVIPAATQTTQNAVTGGSSETEVSPGLRVIPEIRVGPGVRVNPEVRVSSGVSPGSRSVLGSGFVLGSVSECE